MNKRSNLLTVFALILIFFIGSTLCYAQKKTKESIMDDVSFNLLIEDTIEQFGLEAKTMSTKGAGGWSDSEVGPTIYQRGYWRYSPEFDTPATPPINATISYLTWQWSVVNYTQGLLVYICDSNFNGCVDVSTYGTGATTAFNGWPASTNFIMAFGVPGTGTIIPYIYGKSDTVNVSWQNY